MPNIHQQIQEINRLIDIEIQAGRFLVFDNPKLQQEISKTQTQLAVLEQKISGKEILGLDENKNQLILDEMLLKRKLKPLLLQKKNLLLHEILPQQILTLESGDCHFNTLALAFSAEVLNPQSVLAKMSDEEGTEKFAELLKAFGKFHTRIEPNPPTWGVFKMWLNHYANKLDHNGTAYNIEKLLAPVFRKYYVNEIMTEPKEKLTFTKEIKNFIKLRNIHRDTIGELFEKLQNDTRYKDAEKKGFKGRKILEYCAKRYEQKIQIQREYLRKQTNPKLTEDAIDIEIIKYQEENPDILHDITHTGFGYLPPLSTISRADVINAVENKEENYPKMVSNLCLHISRNNETTGLIKNGKYIITENLANIPNTVEELYNDNSNLDKLDDLWMNQVWPNYHERLTKPRATHDGVMKEISNKLLNANLITANYDQVEKMEDPFKDLENPEHSYNLYALGQGQHWVPLIKNTILQHNLYRDNQQTAFNSDREQDILNYYGSRGFPIPYGNKTEISETLEQARKLMIEVARFKQLIPNGDTDTYQLVNKIQQRLLQNMSDLDRRNLFVHDLIDIKSSIKKSTEQYSNAVPLQAKKYQIERIMPSIDTKMQELDNIFKENELLDDNFQMTISLTESLDDIRYSLHNIKVDILSGRDLSFTIARISEAKILLNKYEILSKNIIAEKENLILSKIKINLNQIMITDSKETVAIEELKNIQRELNSPSKLNIQELENIYLKSESIHIDFINKTIDKDSVAIEDLFTKMKDFYQEIELLGDTVEPYFIEDSIREITDFMISLKNEQKKLKKLKLSKGSSNYQLSDHKGIVKKTNRIYLSFNEFINEKRINVISKQHERQQRRVGGHLQAIGKNITQAERFLEIHDFDENDILINAEVKRFLVTKDKLFSLKQRLTIAPAKEVDDILEEVEIISGQYLRSLTKLTEHISQNQQELDQSARLIREQERKAAKIILDQKQKEEKIILEKKNQKQEQKNAKNRMWQAGSYYKAAQKLKIQLETFISESTVHFAETPDELNDLSILIFTIEDLEIELKSMYDSKNPPKKRLRELTDEYTKLELEINESFDLVIGFGKNNLQQNIEILQRKVTSSEEETNFVEDISQFEKESGIKITYPPILTRPNGSTTIRKQLHTVNLDIKRNSNNIDSLKPIDKQFWNKTALISKNVEEITQRHANIIKENAHAIQKEKIKFLIKKLTKFDIPDQNNLIAEKLLKKNAILLDNLNSLKISDPNFNQKISKIKLEIEKDLKSFNEIVTLKKSAYVEHNTDRVNQLTSKITYLKNNTVNTEAFEQSALNLKERLIEMESQNPTEISYGAIKILNQKIRYATNKVDVEIEKYRKNVHFVEQQKIASLNEKINSFSTILLQSKSTVQKSSNQNATNLENLQTVDPEFDIKIKRIQVETENHSNELLQVIQQEKIHCEQHFGKEINNLTSEIKQLNKVNIKTVSLEQQLKRLQKKLDKMKQQNANELTFATVRNINKSIGLITNEIESSITSARQQDINPTIKRAQQMGNMIESVLDTIENTATFGNDNEINLSPMARKKFDTMKLKLKNNIDFLQQLDNNAWVSNSSSDENNISACTEEIEEISKYFTNFVSGYKDMFKTMIEQDKRSRVAESIAEYTNFYDIYQSKRSASASNSKKLFSSKGKQAHIDAAQDIGQLLENFCNDPSKDNLKTLTTKITESKNMIQKKEDSKNVFTKFKLGKSALGELLVEVEKKIDNIIKNELDNTIDFNFNSNF